MSRDSDTVVRLQPLEYVHIFDHNTNATTVLCGPVTLTLPSNQNVVKTAQKFQVILPQSYCVVENPVSRDGSGRVVFAPNGQAKNLLGEREIRFHQPPFPLYPNETVLESQPLPLLSATQSLIIKAVRSFTDSTDPKKPIKREAGDEYLFVGPGTYIPRVEEEIQGKQDAVIVKFNESLHLRAKNKFVDRTGVARQVGEDYLWSRSGAFILDTNETLVAVVPVIILTWDKAVHVEVNKAFFDDRPWAQRNRVPGEVYLLTNAATAEFTPLPFETVKQQVDIIIVGKKQWAIINDPVGPDGTPQLGRRRIVTNTQFFLQPGERLDRQGVRDVFVLAEDESLVVKATEDFDDTDSGTVVKRTSGEKWLLRGPREYIPNESVAIIPNKNSEKRKRLVFGPNEGVYVRDTLSGNIRVISDTAYTLEAYEELWEKDLPAVVEERLRKQLGSHASYMEKDAGGSLQRDKTKVVQYHIPHNAVTQIFDYRLRTRRTVFGPQCVALGPDEEFTVVSLSGSEWDPKRPTECLPKKTGMVKALYMFLGPSCMSDVVNVETRDHARLSLQLSYDWRFDVQHGNVQHAEEAFNVPDFVGDCCSCIASRVRASIAAISFDHFHKNSARLLQVAVFGVDSATQRPKKELRFPNNRLVVTSVDIEKIEVCDEKTREALKQSVKMAIEITTQAQEAVARQEASVREQKARGLLDRQQIQDKAQSEIERKKLIEAQTGCSAIASTGKAKAEARARAQAADIEGDSNVQLARMKSEQTKLMDAAQLDVKQKRTSLGLDHTSVMNELDVRHQKLVSQVESIKFQRVMDAVGPETLTEMARAGPEMQARMLASLGLEGYLVTDGTNPINLFNTAKGLTSAAGTGMPTRPHSA